MKSRHKESERELDKRGLEEEVCSKDKKDMEKAGK